MFERETISNYEENQEKQFENDQESEEDTINNDTISVAESEKSKIIVITVRKPYCKRNNKQTDRLSKEEVELRKAVTQRLTHSPVPKDEDAL